MGSSAVTSNGQPTRVGSRSTATSCRRSTASRWWSSRRWRSCRVAGPGFEQPAAEGDVVEPAVVVRRGRRAVEGKLLGDRSIGLVTADLAVCVLLRCDRGRGRVLGHNRPGACGPWELQCLQRSDHQATEGSSSRRSSRLQRSVGSLLAERICVAGMGWSKAVVGCARR